MTTSKGPSRQRCIRFGGDLEERLAALAEEEGRTFSAQVNWMIRQALASRTFSKQPQQSQHSAAA